MLISSDEVLKRLADYYLRMSPTGHENSAEVMRREYACEIIQECEDIVQDVVDDTIAENNEICQNKTFFDLLGRVLLAINGALLFVAILAKFGNGK